MSSETESSGQYQGSQAFSHIVPGRDESVNNNTGSLHFSKSIVRLRGVRSSIDLNLSISYTNGLAGTFGLPVSWSLGLPYVVPQKSITFMGRTYAIDGNWIDASGYQSGLRYMNDQGVKFSVVVPPQDLPTGKPGQYDFMLRLHDGSTDYFDGLGRPMLHQDLFGNSLHYVYLSDSGAVTDNRSCLDYIIDSWGQKVNFSYQPGDFMRITGPDGAETTVSFGTAGVTAIRDPEGYDTRLAYMSVASDMVLSEISYATGLVSRFEYTSIAYLDARRRTATLPSISKHLHLGPDNRLLKQTSYAFGSNTGGNTFTGLALGCMLGGPQDNVMDSGNVDYRYDLVRSDLDEAGNIITATVVWFNYLHLPMTEIKYTGDQGSRVAAYKSEYTYSIDPDMHARTPNYMQPHVVEHLQNTTRSPDAQPVWQGLQRSTNEYNSFCQPTSQVDEVLKSPVEGYVKTKTTKRDYFPASFGVQLLDTETVSDHLDDSKRVVQNERSESQKTIGKSLVSFRGASNKDEGDPKPLKTLTRDYDGKGRVTKDTTAWSRDEDVPEGSDKSLTSSMSYEDSGGRLKKTIQDSSMGNRSSQVHFNIQVAGGPMVAKILPMGQLETCEYDKLGRLVKRVDTLKAVTTRAYSVGATLNAETVTHPQGYVYRTTFDALGRIVEESDNFDPDEHIREKHDGADAPTRVLKRIGYDVAGRVISTTDSLGLVTSFKFDALGREIETADPSGNVITTSYNDASLVVQKHVNGALSEEAQVNGLGQIVWQKVFPSSADRSADYCLLQEYTYNSAGKKTRDSTSRTSLSGTDAKSFKTVCMSYDADSRLETHVSSGRGDGDASGEDVVTRTYRYDIAGNAYTWEKVTLYGDGRRFTDNGPITIFDMHGRLRLVRDQLRHEEKNNYDDNGWLTSVERSGGITIRYKNNDAGQPLEIESASGKLKVALRYNARGDKTFMEYNEQKTTLEYFRDGSIYSIRYGTTADAPAHTYTRDRFGRVTSEVDVFGTEKKTAYDAFGRNSSIATKDDKVTYRYGRVNNREGVLVGVTMESPEMPYEQQISYNGFYQRSEVTTRRPDQSIVLKTAYKMNKRQRLESVETSAALRPELNQTHSWRYDGIGQLVSETVTPVTGAKTGHDFVYDGNSNILSSTVTRWESGGGSTVQTTKMEYNELGQRTNDARFEYDAAGRLLRDDTGSQYTFDEQDRLVSVKTPDGAQSQVEYHGDNSLAAIARPMEKTEFFYTPDKHVSAVGHRTTDGQEKHKHSLLRDGENVLASHSAAAAAASASAPPVYFFERHGSTALQVSGKDSTAIEYEAYGSSTSTAPLAPQSCFTFGQELADPSSGLLYLRSRFYQPKTRSFISKDSRLVENRYAYCEGDPVNKADPSGHGAEWVAAAAAVVGIAAGTIAGFGMAFAWALAFGAAETLGASVAAGAAVGAVSNVAGSLAAEGASRLLGGEFKYSFGRFVTDVLLGAWGGGVAGAVGFGRESFLWDALAGFADAGTQFGFEAVAYGVQGKFLEMFDVQFAVEAPLGLVVGLATGKLGSKFTARAVRMRKARLDRKAAALLGEKKPLTTNQQWTQVATTKPNGSPAHNDSDGPFTEIELGALGGRM